MLDQPSSSNNSDPEVRKRMAEASKLVSEGSKLQAVPLLEENVRAGCTASMVLLGTILADGSEEDRAHSLSLFRQAGELGNSSGVRNLAYCYAIGFNVEKDKAEGARLYTKAAEMGNARAACNIGVMLDYGNGVEQDFVKAFYWFRKSAEGGYTRGMTNLGDYYWKGKGTAKDVPSAICWLEKSGSPRATYYLYLIYRDEEGYKDPSKAHELLKRSAELGYTKGMVEYGECIETSDPSDAIGFYEKAAARGNQAAIDHLNRLGAPVPESRRRRKKN